MKLNRISAFIAIVLAIVIVGGQFLRPAEAAPNQPVQPSITAQLQPRSQTPNDQFPYVINVQGRLTNASGQPITSGVSVVFKLYDAASGGITLYSSTANITPDANGLFTYPLGPDGGLDTLQTDFSNPIWLGITVGTDNEMTPRLLLTAAPYALSLAGGSIISGPINGSYRQGALTVRNTSPASGSNGIYASAVGDTSYGGFFIGTNGMFAHGQGIGVQGYNTSSGSGANYAAQFQNNGSGTGQQYGLYASNENTVGSPGYGGFIFNNGRNGSQIGLAAGTLVGYGIFGGSSGGNAYDSSVGVVGKSSAAFGFGGVFTGSVGLMASGGDVPNFAIAGDGLDVVGYNATGTDFAIASSVPIGGSDYTLYGNARIRGSNITAQSYDLEVQYNGSTPAQLDDVLVADGTVVVANGVPIAGVIKANPQNAAAALGILSHRLHEQTQSGHSRLVIDAAATAVQPGDHAYITVVGLVQVNVKGASVGQHLTVTGSGLIPAQSDAASVGKLISSPDKDGKAYAYVNFK